MQSFFPNRFRELASECYMQSVEAFTKLFQNGDFYRSVQEEIAKEVFRELYK